MALWLLLFIYARTLIKLALGKGALSKRILLDYVSPIDDIKMVNKIIHYLNRIHIYFGISALAAVLALVIWQGLFGLFISWQYSPKELKKLSYLIFTSIMINIRVLKDVNGSMSA
ncbi:hypothetical protein BHECKSOX_417 [Bathymodiolus heckerae thiotrophic gill symbiont]|uniref:hypothetical protein n=1 Tax=Bathymodiolus heckerae thiotrophic gill symbiont TaxID=1052212 RepID=UPI0010B12247|nr:hypothetical protein [Bathymodiolus heckerae thiotrophic gill symbiont]CAC9581829.1 hypothetical protein [uncultured Gammaproteobacteria bacterium]SHN90247.1 hypothetical protein BHECKSOX_417 [Bathymodiolus heckerae thiotrophic gill symbiont]